MANIVEAIRVQPREDAWRLGKQKRAEASVRIPAQVLANDLRVVRRHGLLEKRRFARLQGDLG